MFTQALTVALVFCGLVLAALILVQQIGALRYDVRLTHLRKARQLHPNARRYRYRPLITVIIPTHNDAALIERCLQSIFASSYRKVQVIVVDAASSDDTRKIVKQFMAEHSKRNIRLRANRSLLPRAVASRAAYLKYGQGELVMIVQPTDQLDKQALACAVAHFNDDDQLDALVPTRTTAFNQTITSLLQKYLNLLQLRSQKSNVIVQPPQSIYRRQAFLLKRLVGTVYANNVLITTEPPASLRSILLLQYRLQLTQAQALSTSRRLFVLEGGVRITLRKWFSLLLHFYLGLAAVLVPLLSGYFIYLAVSLHEPTLLLVSWAVAALFVSVAIWDNAYLNLRQKLSYTLGIPLTYGLLYILSLLQLIVQLRIAMPYRLSIVDTP